ncbi:MAG: hypothetical protein K8F54_12695 [Altibacter sp.]|uniref:hypothetical protein n=1 Tax=Altibacter sp. TaxID=2024823 RepID=UPI001D527AFC|nr:hypothetical protein [Altibacter sp.]MBZ0328461.1 hypothetical protein [Altibacter sp.]
MKKLIISLTLGTSALLGCGGNDDGGSSGNYPPNDFALLTVANQSENVDRMPQLSWEAAIDPDGDAVTYSLYLQKLSEEDQLIADNLPTTEFQLTTLLSLIQEYSWYVVAKDGKGGETATLPFFFTTRNITLGQQVNPAAGFAPRGFHATFTFQNKLFLLGGLDFSDQYNDVWSTQDGALWVNETPAAAFGKGDSFSLVELNDKMYLIGGNSSNGVSDDVWFSNDGVGWTQLLNNAPFGPRITESATLDDKIWVVGGYNTSFFNDAWVSQDGGTWNVATQNAAFTARALHQLVSFKNKLWVIGGGLPSLAFQDVWSSSDGISWLEETSSAAFGPRFGHIVVQYDGKLWLFGGSDDSTTPVPSIWYSEDGVIWNVAVANSPALLDRTGFEVTVYKDKIWLTGGKVGSALKNDVWMFE